LKIQKNNFFIWEKSVILTYWKCEIFKKDVKMQHVNMQKETLLKENLMQYSGLKVKITVLYENYDAEFDKKFAGSYETVNGVYIHYYKGYKLHREDGPAVDWESGHKRYYLNGIQYTENEYNERIAK
jgi:hypothetical protein